MLPDFHVDLKERWSLLIFYRELVCAKTFYGRIVLFSGAIRSKAPAEDLFVSFFLQIAL